MVMQCWRDRCEGLGMKLLYLCGGKLVVERNNPPRSSLVTEQCFADDAIITASTREDITKATMELKQVTNEYGLTISFPKTKLLLVVGTGITDTDNNLASLSIGIVVLLNQYHTDSITLISKYLKDGLVYHPLDIWGHLLKVMVEWH